jgi:hypothetical protein
LPGIEEGKMLALPFACDLLLDNINRASDRPLEAVLVTNPEGRELMTILTKDIFRKSLLH